MISQMSVDHRDEVRRLRRSKVLDDTTIKDLAKTENILEGVVTYVAGQRERREKSDDGPRALKTMIDSKDIEIAALKAQVDAVRRNLGRSNQSASCVL